MEFVTEGNAINCIKTVYDPETGESMETVVVSFDANVDRVPPHVAASLNPEEIKQLDLWIEERAKLQSTLETRPVEKTVLEALPAVLEEALHALDDIDELDIEVFKDIKRTLLKLDEAINSFQPLSEEETVVIRQLQSSEVLKEQLDTIKKKL